MDSHILNIAGNPPVPRAIPTKARGKHGKQKKGKRKQPTLSLAEKKEMAEHRKKVAEESIQAITAKQEMKHEIEKEVESLLLDHTDAKSHYDAFVDSFDEELKTGHTKIKEYNAAQHDITQKEKADIKQARDACTQAINEAKAESKVERQTARNSIQPTFTRRSAIHDAFKANYEKYTKNQAVAAKEKREADAAAKKAETAQEPEDQNKVGDVTSPTRMTADINLMSKMPSYLRPFST